MIEKKIDARRPCSTTEMIKKTADVKHIVEKKETSDGTRKYSGTKSSQSRTMKISLSFDLACFNRMDSL